MLLHLKHFPYYSNLSNFVRSLPFKTHTTQQQKPSPWPKPSKRQTPPLDRRPVLICVVDESISHAIHHFAHSMQQLYGCWSIWETARHNPSLTSKPTNDSNSTKMTHPELVQPILVVSSKVQHKWKKQPFLSGFLECLIESYGVTILSSSQLVEWSQEWNVPDNTGCDKKHNPTHKWNQNKKKNNKKQITFKQWESELLLVQTSQQISIQGGYTLHNASHLVDMVTSHYGLDSTLNGTKDLSLASLQILPCIGILNRRKSVGWTNRHHCHHHCHRYSANLPWSCFPTTK